MINEELWEFPHKANLKIIGEKGVALDEVVIEIFEQYKLQHDPVGFTLKQSTKGNFISLTCAVVFENKAQVESVYGAFNDSPDIKVFL